MSKGGHEETSVAPSCFQFVESFPKNRIPVVPIPAVAAADVRCQKGLTK